jgi:hypothetical protein
MTASNERQRLSLVRELRDAAGTCDHHAFDLRRVVNEFEAKVISASAVEELLGQVRAIATAVEEHGQYLDATADQHGRLRLVAAELHSVRVPDAVQP